MMKKAVCNLVIKFLQEEIDENILQELAYCKEHSTPANLAEVQTRLAEFQEAIATLRKES